MQKLGNIYIFKNNLNRKMYIGQTIQGLNRRVWQHKNRAFNHNGATPLYNALRKYGMDNFTIHNYIVDIDDLNELETFLIEEYSTQDKKYGYNICEGGASRKGLKQSQEARKKIGAASKGNKYLLGYKQSKETIEKRSKALRGQKRSQETKDKMSINIKNFWDGNIEAKEKARNQKLGEKNSKAKFTNEFIKNLKNEYAEGNITKKEIANKYNMVYSTCANILNGYKWSHI